LTITGSIGVIMHGYNYRKLMDKVGVVPHVYKSGKFKDMLSGELEPDDDSPPAVARREEEDAMVQSLIDETYGKFKSVVQAGRDAASKANAGDGRPLADNWTDFADGRILSGKRALELGLVDELGDFQTAVKRAEKLTSITGANLVEYRVPVDLSSVLSHVFGKSEAPTLKVDLGIELPRLRAGLPYYILPTAIPN
jgi:protease-4